MIKTYKEFIDDTEEPDILDIDNASNCNHINTIC